MSFVRRHRLVLTIGSAMLVVLLTISWFQRNSTGSGGPLDPANPHPTGARAVAQVLAAHGVPVDVVRGRAALDRVRVDSGTTVMVGNPDDLGAATWADVDARTRAAGAVLVVAGLSGAVSDGLGLGENDLTTSADRTTVSASCSPSQPLVDGLSLTSHFTADAVRGDGCFGNAQSRELLVDRQGSRWVLTNPHPVTNEEIGLGDNAAVVLRLLGQRSRVVWYVADPNEMAITDGVGLGRLLPRWLTPSLWLLALATIALLLWRGRRLGPLVVEPLPVAIKALESTTTLGRLYERARDRPHAARLLVDGTAGRLVDRLGLAPTASRDMLIEAIAARTGRPVAEVATLLPEPELLGDRVRGDAELVTLAQNLHQLEEEVRTR